jgi:hypothetical protein
MHATPGSSVTGELELSVANFSDFEQIKALIMNAYEGRGQAKPQQTI